MPESFGSFSWICAHSPSPECNLFFRQLYRADPPYLTRLFPNTSDFYELYDVVADSARGDPNVDAAVRQAGAGLGASCVIARAGQRGSLGDVALIVLSALSFIVAAGLAVHASRRKAAVGRAELRILLIIITMSSLLEQSQSPRTPRTERRDARLLISTASTALVVISAMQLALLAALFWVLLANAIVATQVVECRDGTPAALIPLSIITFLVFGATLYIALDTGLSWTQAFQITASEVPNLQGTTLFVLTLIWPAAAAVLYFIIMVFVCLRNLREKKPAGNCGFSWDTISLNIPVLYILAFALFAAAQVIYFLASQPLCEASMGKVNSAFLATLLNTAAIGVIYWAWMVITEDDWTGDQYAYGYGY